MENNTLKVAQTSDLIKLHFVFVIIVILILGFIFNDMINVASLSASLSGFTFVKKIPQEDTSEIQIFQPEGVDVDSEGNVYINDIELNRIVKFSENGTYI